MCCLPGKVCTRGVWAGGGRPRAAESKCQKRAACSAVDQVCLLALLLRYIAATATATAPPRVEVSHGQCWALLKMFASIRTCLSSLSPTQRPTIWLANFFSLSAFFFSSNHKTMFHPHTSVVPNKRTTQMPCCKKTSRSSSLIRNQLSCKIKRDQLTDLPLPFCGKDASSSYKMKQKIEVMFGCLWVTLCKQLHYTCFISPLILSKSILLFKYREDMRKYRNINFFLR